MARLIEASLDKRAAARSPRHSYLARAACAVFDVARAVSRHSRGRERIGLPDHERASRRIGRGGGVPRDGSGPGAACSKPSACGATTGRRRAAVRCSFSSGMACSTRRTLVVHGVQFDDAALARLRALRRDARHLPAQQSVGGRGLSADRALLSVGRRRRRRHRQSCERRRSEPVLRAEDDALARAGGAGAAGCSRARRSWAPGRWAWTTSSDRSTPGKRAELIAVDLPDAVDDVEEYLVSGIEVQIAGHVGKC